MPATFSPITEGSGDATSFNINSAGHLHIPYTATDRSTRTLTSATNGGGVKHGPSRYKTVEVVSRDLSRSDTGNIDGAFQCISDGRGWFRFQGNNCGGSVPAGPLAHNKKRHTIDIVDPRTGEKILL